MSKEIYIACDHAGYGLKSVLSGALEGWGYAVKDLGTTDSDKSVDYPDYAEKLAHALKEKSCLGVLICGSGIGISIAANRYPWLRVALCCDEDMAKLARQHNDANVIAFGARLTEESQALKALEAFLGAEFEGGRHSARVEKLNRTQI